MTVSLKHAFTSNVADSGDATLVQPSNWNAEHNLTANANSLLGTVTSGSVTEISCTSAGRDLLDDADASAQRTTLGLGSIATQNANNVSITGGSITNITDLAVADGGTGASTATAAATNLGLGTGDSPQFAGVNIGNATDTTITRASAGVIAVEGNQVPSPGSVAQGDVLYYNGTTWVRLAAGTSGQILVTAGSSANPSWKNKVVVSSTTSTTSPWAWNSDGVDQFAFTALANDLTINADSGSPVDGQRVTFRFLPNTTGIDLTWTTGSSKSFRAVGVTLPTALSNAKTTYVGCIYNTADSRWDAVAVSTEA